jgi:adenylate cyclase class 2
MEKVEVEIRTFISTSQYAKLAKKLKKIAKFKGEINEETIYCGSERLRIRRDNRASYLILKSGKIHQDFREEIEIKFKKEDFEKMKEILERIGFPVIAIWKRKRLVFLWEGIKVFLDETKGYGKIIELEKITDKKNKEKVYAKLKSKLKSLGIKKITPKEIFEQRFKSYLKKWKK